MNKIYKYQSITLLFSYLIFFSYSSFAEDVIWKSGLNQYIKYANQDSSKFGDNDHPVDLDEKDIYFALKALEYEEKSLLSYSEQLRYVFTTLQLKILSQTLSKSFKNAKKDQDIIFVLQKAEDKLLGLKERTFNAGRMFFKDGKLNIIMGDYEYFRSEAFESAYDPGGQSAVPYNFNFGKRTRRSKAFENTTFISTGIEAKRLEGERRHDWLVIDVKTAAKAYLAGVNEKNNPVTKADKQLEKEAAKLAKQRREMRAEMARMRKEVQAVSEGSSSSSSSRSIEERMATLDELLGKKLITQDEYDSKRKEILNDI
jgi:hypothetical protein